MEKGSLNIFYLSVINIKVSSIVSFIAIQSAHFINVEFIFFLNYTYSESIQGPIVDFLNSKNIWLSKVFVVDNNNAGKQII